MANIVANVNQVLYNSPQVSSLVGGQVAAAEEALRQGQAAEARRQEDALAKMVIAMEGAAGSGTDALDGEERRGTRRERVARLKDERELRLRAARAARRERQARAAAEIKRGRNAGCADDASEPSSVIDVCI